MANIARRLNSLVPLAFAAFTIAAMPVLAQEAAPDTEAADSRPEYTDAKPEPEVDAALRQQVTNFFQYHVDGDLRKAFEIVAEDTKDEYFAEGKMQILSFKIDSVQYADDLEHALVSMTVARVWGFHGQETDVTIPMVTTWKVEEGEWRWYHDKGRDSITPMGFSNIETMKPNVLITQNEDGSVNLPKDFSQETLLMAMSEILQKSDIDKTEIVLKASEASEDSFVFHNSHNGSLALEMTGIPEMEGLNVSLDKPMLNGQEDAKITVRYAPPTEDAATPDPIQINLTTVPFGQHFYLHVRFE